MTILILAIGLWFGLAVLIVALCVTAKRGDADLRSGAAESSRPAEAQGTRGLRPVLRV